MNTQPEALRLADWLEHQVPMTPPLRAEAAAELRRLHEANQELLEALKLVTAMCIRHDFVGWDQMPKARAALAKHGGAA
jgi:hypothetical protein